MSGLQLRSIRAGSAVYLPGDRFGPRTLHDYELVLITAGAARYVADGTAHDAPPNCFILARPGFHERYEWDTRQTSRHLFFHFEPTRLPGDWPAPRHWPVVQPSSEADPMPAMMDHVIRLITARPHDEGDPGPAITRQVEALLDLVIRGPESRPLVPDAAGPQVPPPVMRAMDWVHVCLRDDPAADIDLETLARTAGVTTKHLCRLFNDTLGHTPIQWVRRCRLEHARVLLRRSNLTTAQIADRIGYHSPFHFSRAYKQHFGAAPSHDRFT
jgi:AraC-like DNA-binding protein